MTEQVADPEVVLPFFTCQRCGHTWVPRLARMPRLCPACKSFLWQTPRKKKGD